jgi:alpha-galactosidase
LERSEKALDDQRTERTLTFKDPKTGLLVRCAGIEYNDFPTVEWTLHFKNAGAAETPIISDIQALDTRFDRNPSGEFMLHHWNGTYVNRSDYEPHETQLKPGESKTFTPTHGRPCAGEFPYYNIEWNGEGVIAAVGWPGKWSASFTRDAGMGLRVAAGQERTYFKLLPGEEIRTPLIVLQFWKGGMVRAQNVWRRWMFAHNLPRRNGALPPPQMPAVSGNQFPGLLCNEADEIRYIDRFEEEGIKITHWWMDAGWYVNKGDWTSVGTWEVDTGRFPRGIRAVADHAHAKGIKLIVWFEPERVTPGSWLAENHPAWVLGGKAGGLLNLGNRDAWNWLVEHFDKIITEQGIDFYRQDFNMDPLPFWRNNDAEDRQGITEIRHVEGYLAFWDELVRRHPDMMIDSCASGGHRNDLETLRRSVPLLRSDYIFDWTGEQCHTYGFASWVPYWGTGLIDFDAYSFRSCLGLDTTLSCDARRKDLDWDLLRKLTAQWRDLAPNFQGDYYPLTKYSAEDDVWMAWQFDVPEKGQGMVQAFRRPKSNYESARFALNGLDPDAVYVVTDVDANNPQEISGRELTEKGLLITLPDAPGSAIITYRKR